MNKDSNPYDLSEQPSLDELQKRSNKKKKFKQTDPYDLSTRREEDATKSD